MEESVSSLAEGLNSRLSKLVHQARGLAERTSPIDSDLATSRSATGGEPTLHSVLQDCHDSVSGLEEWLMQLEKGVGIVNGRSDQAAPTHALVARRGG